MKSSAAAATGRDRPQVWGQGGTEPLNEYLWSLNETVIGPHFPKPPALHARVEFWRRIYTESGAGDFVLHDRENLGVSYEVVQVGAEAKSIHELATLSSFSSELTGSRGHQLAPISRFRCEYC